VFGDFWPLLALFIGLFIGAFLVYQVVEISMEKADQEKYLRGEVDFKSATSKALDQERYMDTIAQISGGKEGRYLPTGYGARHFDMWGNIYYNDPASGRRVYFDPPKLPKGLEDKK
jgi:hypothetical protein